MMKNTEIAHLFALVERMEALYRPEILSILTSLYWETLERFEFRDIQKAFNAHLANPSVKDFFPNPKHLARLLEKRLRAKKL